jgi:rRNA biogenesis protein RRP5
MAAAKRKAEHGSVSTKKEAGTSSDRAAKRSRKSDAIEEGSKSAKSPIVKLQNAPQKSVFKEEEKAFPRGGASVLTPLEHKQIQIKANQDVLFEQSGLKRVGGDDLSDIASEDDAENTPKASKKKKSKKNKKNHAEEEEETVRVESLSFKVSSRSSRHLQC